MAAADRKPTIGDITAELKPGARVICRRSASGPPLFEGVVNPDGTLELLDPAGAPVGTGRFDRQREALDVVLADGTVETIPLQGTALRVTSPGGHAITLAIAAGTGALTVASIGAVSDGGLRLRTGSGHVTVPAGVTVTAAANGHVFFDGGPLSSQRWAPGQVVTQHAAPPPAASPAPNPNPTLSIPGQGQMDATTYAGKISATIGSIGSLATRMGDHAASVYTILSALQAELARVDAAIGTDARAQTFRASFMSAWNDLQNRILTPLGDNLVNLGSGLNQNADSLLETENRNLANVKGCTVQITDPRPHAGSHGRLS